LSILLSLIFLSLHMIFDLFKKIVDKNINSILINWECAFNKCMPQASGLSSPKNFWAIKPNPFLVGLLGQWRKKYKWSTHYDFECVTHLWGMHCECNSIGAHHAVISTKGPVRPTRIIYSYLKGDNNDPLCVQWTSRTESLVSKNLSSSLGMRLIQSIKRHASWFNEKRS